MKKSEGFNSKSTVLTMTCTAISVALIVVCTLISVPTVVPFTLQTFALFVILGLFDAKISILSVVVYILMGLVGLPVFAGQKSGIAVIFGPTGGYLIGFILCMLICTLLRKIKKDSNVVMVVGWVVGMVVYDLFGTVWFCAVYTKELSGAAFISALSVCVLPFIIPDLLKMAAALFIVDRITLPLKKMGLGLASPRAYKSTEKSDFNC
ncbi:MAG: biotin transporter BioY [Lachnospiraceae bacterium]|nr:biotin transporter BioY [Lachnospiraceae bacterium]